ncbi:MAG: VWA domain-containing protein, partial [Saprospiraceae bacterium]|nr:VWA domain-containing protein [Saprospiraceae bacterium]
MVMVISLALNLPDKTVKGIVVSNDKGTPLSGVMVEEKGRINGTITDSKGEFELMVKDENATLVFKYSGFKTQEIKVGKEVWIYVKMIQKISNEPIELIEVEDESAEELILGHPKRNWKRADKMASPASYNGAGRQQYQSSGDNQNYQDWNTENYATIHENIFLEPTKNPLSTFSIDVDAASYSNIRRFINNGQNPPKDAVRIEEMVNYFKYEYRQPDGEDPFAIYTELSHAPWNEKHKLLKIGLQGKEIPKENLPASNLVFLLDVSGSMSDFNKLPLLKSSFKLLVNELRPEDRVAIVVYAGAAGVVLPSTPGNQKEIIMESLDRLQAGGSTAGGAGIKLAYKIAKDYFIEGGNNRIILATDGDFNIGESSDAGMERLIEQKRNEGVFLTVLG